MRENFDVCLTMLLKHEGGYVNHPKDPGGETNLGVTRAVYEQHLGRQVMDGEMCSTTHTKEPRVSLSGNTGFSLFVLFVINQFS
jgi:lysozyme family protein